MSMIRKLVQAQITELADDEVEVIMSTASLARDGHVLIPQGCRLENYRRNPICLWSHDPDKPVGNAETVSVDQDQIVARIKFAPLGISHKADEVRGLTKAGVIRAVSVGFDPIEMEPLNPSRPKGGQRISDWELLEMSFVSVPSDAGAVVTNRSHGDETMSEVPDDTNKPAGDPASAPQNRSVKPSNSRVAVVLGERGLYQVAQICYLFEELGWQVDMAKIESSVEGDSSKVPAMLGAVLQDLGEALLAMTQEEIAEALAGHDIEPEEDEEDEILVVEERQHIRAGKTAHVRAFRRGMARAKLRAGKTLSAETISCLRDAMACHEDAMDMHRSAMRKHKEGMGAISGMTDRAGVSDPESDAAQTVQKSDGTQVDEGSRALTHDFRRRQVDVLALSRA